MKTFRFVLVTSAAAIIIVLLLVNDFRQQGWSTNVVTYLRILAVILLIISIILSIKELKGK